MAERTVDLIIRARDQASQAFGNLNGALKELTGVQQRVARGADLMKAALSGSEQDVQRLTNALKSGDALRAKDGFEQLGQTVERLGAKMRAQQSDVDESRDAYRALVAQARAARDALDRMNSAIGPRTQDEATRIKATETAVKSLTNEARRAETTWEKQQAALEETANAYNRLEAAAGVYGGELRRLGLAQRAYTAAAAGDDAARVAREFREAAAAAREKSQAARITAAEQERLNAALRETYPAARRVIAGLRGSASSVALLAREMRTFATTAGRASAAMNDFGGANTLVRRALREFYGDSRRALSLMQRLRGEVLSLTAAFVGFYGIFEQGNQIVTAFRSAEEAANRLEAAVGGNAQAAAAELGFLRTEAQRLGISFDTLATNYSSFLISGTQAGLEMSEVREIFTSVTEAGRVLGLNNERMGRTFTALTQIAGKGTVQMEELRQQLGDNLPGAVGILANALGYGEDELDQFYDAVEAGNVSAREGLLALAQGLDDVFGNQLEASLENVNAQIGRLQDNLFQRRLTAANAGFIDGLETAIAALNEFLDSDAGVEFFESIGAAAGRFLEIVPGIIDNMDLLFGLLQALVAVKLAQTFRNGFAALATFGGGAERARNATLAFNTSLYRINPAMAQAMVGTTRFGAGLRGLRAVMVQTTLAARGLWAALGGPVGIALTALSFVGTELFFNMATEVDTANDAVNRHQRVVDEVTAAYMDAQRAGTDWIERLRNDANGLTQAQLRAAITVARDASQQIRAELERATERLFLGFGDLVSGNRTITVGEVAFEVDARAARDLNNLVSQFNDGAIDAAEFEQALSDLAREANDPDFDRLVGALSEMRQESEDAETRVEFLEAALAVLEGTASDAQRELVEGTVAVEGLGGAMDEEASSVDGFTRALEGMNGALQTLTGLVPSLREAVRLGEDVAEVEAAYQEAVNAAMALPSGEREAALAEALRLRDMAVSELTQAYEARQDYAPVYAERMGTPTGSNDEELVRAVSEVAARRGWSAEDLLTIMSFETGGTLDPWQAGPTTQWGQHRGLIQWGEPQRERYGVTQETSIRDQVLAAERYLLDAGATQGMAGLNLYAAINAGDPNRTGASDEFNGGTPGSVADKWYEQMDGHRARAQGLLEVYGQVSEETARGVEAERERGEAQAEFTEGLNASLEQQEFENSLADARMIDREVALAIREAENEAAEVGLELSDEQRQQIEAVTRARLAGQQAAEDTRMSEEARNEQLEQGRALEEDITRLQERQRFLQEELAFAQSQGDTAAATSVQEELTAVNTELDGAIQRAIQFWEALGGEGSAAAIQALQQTQAEMARTAAVTVTSGEQMNNMIAGKLTSAIQRFAERVANGEDAWTAFKEEFLRAIGEMLIEIGVMIVRQAILNALMGGGGPNGGVGGGLAGFINGLFHTGGVAGNTPTSQRTVDPAVFANAIRYHTGGIAGLRPNEVAAVLEEGEEVLTENDPRHRRNAGMSGNGQTIINAFDAAGFLDAALASAAGGDAILNYVRANRETVKAALE